MMVKSSKTKIKNDDLNTSNSKDGKSSPPARLYIDVAIFFVLILVISSAMIVVSTLPKDNTSYYTEYTETDEYIEESMDNILDSTVPVVSYHSNPKMETQYYDYSFEDLILLDITIRIGQAGEANLTSLETGIESELKNLLDQSLGEHSGYILTAIEGNSQNNSISIIISNQPGAVFPVNSGEPDFEKQLISSYSREDGDKDPGIIIRLYLD
jgi:hypothetical protein